MKKIYTLLLIIATTPLFAQNYAEWYFDEDAEGWTTSGDGVVFSWTDEGPAPTASIWAVPPLLGTDEGGWMMLDDDALGQNVSTETFFESPVLDLSEAPNQLKIEFDQYFQEWETGSDTTQVQVSSDGGMSWHTITFNDGVGRSNRPNPEHMIANITPGIQDDSTSVQIRFRYRADWSYGWQVDNITISELPDYDLVAWEAFTDNILTEYEYRRVPLGQTQELETGFVIRNLGAKTLTGINGTLTVLDPQGSEVPLSVSTGAIDSLITFDQDTLWMATGLTPDQIGNYTFTFSVTADQEDDEIAVGNESVTRILEITEETYGHVFDTDLNFQANGREVDGLYNEYMMGNVFEIVETTDILRVQCKLGSKTTPDQELDVWIYRWDDTDEETGDLIVEEITSYQYYTPITQEDIDSEEYLSIEITDQISLEPGIYIIGLHSLGQGDQFWVESEFHETDFSTVLWGDFNQAGADWWFGWPFSPSVRIQTGTWTPGVLDVENDLFVLGQNRPNPATDNTIIPVQLKQSGDLTLTIRDITGRIVLNEYQGNLPAGIHQLEIDTDTWGAGTYFYTIQSQGVQSTRKMIVD